MALSANNGQFLYIVISSIQMQANIQLFNNQGMVTWMVGVCGIGEAEPPVLKHLVLVIVKCSHLSP